jgi:F-type H+-transporting ATPase subunit a
VQHPFTWYNALPESLQHLFGDHTFFAIVAGILLIFFAIKARGALAKAADPVVPAAELGSRNIAELIVQLIVNQSDAIIGKPGRKYVPFFGTFFFFILLSNLMGLVPGFAPPTGNLNTTLGLAIVSFIGYNVIGVKEMGGSYFKHFIGPMTSLPGSGLISKLAFLPVLLISVAFFFILEIFSHGFRPVSLSLRLFGNMMGDHEVIGAFINLTKLVVPVAFYFMGTLVCLIQAFVFTLLSMIYVALAISHGHDEEHGHEGGHHESHAAHH